MAQGITATASEQVNLILQLYVLTYPRAEPGAEREVGPEQT